MKVEIAVEKGLREKRRVGNKKWIGLNNVEEWTRNGLTQAG